MSDSQRHEVAPIRTEVLGQLTPTISHMRHGKWLVEEQNLAEAVVHYFSNGHLPEAKGYTLRAYLAGMLACQPMRITKRFFGSVGMMYLIRHFGSGHCAHRRVRL